MVENITEFFKSLPPKLCYKCGKIMEEQHEAYLNECDHCNSDMK